MKRRSNLLLPLAVGVSLLIVGSCAIPLTDLDEAEENVPIHVTALAVGTPISTLVIEVTAEDIHGRLVFNLQVVGDVARGVIEVPAGEARTFTVTAYDDHHNVTHTGSETVDVNPGSNPPLNVKLKPVAGEVDVTVRFGDYGVVVTPSAVAFDALGQTAELVATVFDQYDEEVPDTEVVWATTHPTIASVSSVGLVTALAEGEATIVATYAGVAGTCEVTVNDLVGNEPPVAVAKWWDGFEYVSYDPGPMACTNTFIALSGSESYDPEGQPLSYEWRFLDMPPGSSPLFSDPTSATPDLSIVESGDYVIGLIVFDGLVYSLEAELHFNCY